MKNFYNPSVFGMMSLVFLLFFGNSFSVIAQSGTATVTTDKERSKSRKPSHKIGMAFFRTIKNHSQMTVVFFIKLILQKPL
ncbi:hypothetical protein [Algoriphagus aquimarinus]|uniref:hypothetical protein n=1 Tax=Algoriphagus aquimarinus TaxID=237018 RepID=UPI0030D89240